jgi:hypothetical protein
MGLSHQTPEKKVHCYNFAFRSGCGIFPPPLFLLSVNTPLEYFWDPHPPLPPRPPFQYRSAIRTYRLADNCIQTFIEDIAKLVKMATNSSKVCAFTLLQNTKTKIINYEKLAALSFFFNIPQTLL